jgi:hypothetical protein
MKADVCPKNCECPAAAGILSCLVSPANEREG